MGKREDVRLDAPACISRLTRERASSERTLRRGEHGPGLTVLDETSWPSLDQVSDDQRFLIDR
jgi:hypothetical protein